MMHIRLRNILIAFATWLFLTGCLKTEGTLVIMGKVIDDYTKMQIPGRNIIVQGLVRNNEETVQIDAGQFTTDSSGGFSYSLKKIKDARYYNFFLVGDSDYVFKIKNLGLRELEQNAKFLSFSLSRLVDFTIKIYRKSKTPLYDTLYLSWKSDEVSGEDLYPYKVYNFEKTDNLSGQTSGLRLKWTGGYVNSTIRTKVFADKRTKLSWELLRNRKKKEFTDTITCRRDITNIVYFTY